MRAVYNLSKCPASFNFIEFLVTAKTLGYQGVVLDDSHGIKEKYSDIETRKRLESIVEPACYFAEMPWRYGRAEKDDVELKYHARSVLSAYNIIGKIYKLKSFLEPKKERFTVTLRKCKRQPERNSNDRDWRFFAKQIGAVVIEDYDDNPIHLHERMALYAGAEMNYFTNGGPSVLCVYSNYPFKLWMKQPNDIYLNKFSLGMGKQFPWQGNHQKIIWEEDTSESIFSELPLKAAA